MVGFFDKIVHAFRGGEDPRIQQAWQGLLAKEYTLAGDLFAASKRKSRALGIGRVENLGPTKESQALAFTLNLFSAGETHAGGFITVRVSRPSLCLGKYVGVTITFLVSSLGKSTFQERRIPMVKPLLQRDVQNIDIQDPQKAIVDAFLRFLETNETKEIIQKTMLPLAERVKS